MNRSPSTAAVPPGRLVAAVGTAVVAPSDMVAKLNDGAPPGAPVS